MNGSTEKQFQVLTLVFIFIVPKAQFSNLFFINSPISMNGYINNSIQLLTFINSNYIRSPCINHPININIKILYSGTAGRTWSHQNVSQLLPTIQPVNISSNLIMSGSILHTSQLNSDVLKGVQA